MSNQRVEIPRGIVEGLMRRYDAMQKKMRELDAQAMAQVTRWQWATREYYTLRPLYNERLRSPKGQLLAGEPDKPGTLWLFGFDENDRMLTRCYYARYAEPDTAEYMLYDNDGIEVLRYLGFHIVDDYALCGVGRLHGDPQQPEWYAEVSYLYSDARLKYEVYRYEADKLVEVRLLWQHGLATDAYIDQATHYVSYDPSGKPTVIIDSPYLENIKQSSSKLIELTSEASLLAEKLQQVVIETLQADAVHLRNIGTYCWLELSYDLEVNHGMTIIVETEAQRKAYMDSTYNRSLYSMLSYRSESVPTWQTIDVVELPSELETYVNNCRQRKDWGAVRALFITTARVLNEYEWDSLLNVTADFIVFTHDGDRRSNIEDEIRKCAPADKIDQWLEWLV